MEGSSNEAYDESHHDGYESIEEAQIPQTQQQHDNDLEQQQQPYLYPPNSTNSAIPSLRARSTMEDSDSGGGGSQPPLLEIPEEIYAVRKAALQVYKPLTKTWVSAVKQPLQARWSLGFNVEDLTL